MPEPTLTFRREDHTYWLGKRELPSVTRIIRAAGLVDSTWFTEEGRQTGEDIAELTMRYDLGDENAVHGILVGLPELQGYLDAWRNFLLDSEFVIETIEQPMCDPIRCYAGTPDREGLWQGQPTTLDMKRYPRVPWHGVQLAAYAPKSRRLHVQLKPNGTYNRYEFTDPGDYAMWSLALAGFHWKANHGVKQHGYDDGS